MGLIGAAVTFRQVNFYQSALARALNEGLVSVPREIELGLKPPIAYRVLSYLGYVTGIVGTGIWGYGGLFDKIDSGYLVSVATQEGAGRSSTAQLLHASEAVFWVDLQEQLAGLLQTVPDGPGSEVIIESTGNQFGDEFHQFWRRAVVGESEFKAIFLPWSIDPTYRAPLPDDFVIAGEEKHLAELHGLDQQQIVWRRNKIAQLGNERYFAREYLGFDRSTRVRKRPCSFPGWSAGNLVHAMLRFTQSRPGERSRMRAVRALFLGHRAERTPEGRSLRLLSACCRQLNGLTGLFRSRRRRHTGKQYRIYPGAGMKVCEVDEKGRPTLGLCFMPVGELPIGDVMLSQKIALENCESSALSVARQFVPNAFSFRRSRLLG